MPIYDCCRTTTKTIALPSRKGCARAHVTNIKIPKHRGGGGGALLLLVVVVVLCFLAQIYLPISRFRLLCLRVYSYQYYFSHVAKKESVSGFSPRHLHPVWGEQTNKPSRVRSRQASNFFVGRNRALRPAAVHVYMCMHWYYSYIQVPAQPQQCFIRNAMLAPVGSTTYPVGFRALSMHSTAAADADAAGFGVGVCLYTCCARAIRISKDRRKKEKNK